MLLTVDGSQNVQTPNINSNTDPTTHSLPSTDKKHDEDLTQKKNSPNFENDSFVRRPSFKSFYTNSPLTIRLALFLNVPAVHMVPSAQNVSAVKQPTTTTYTGINDKLFLKTERLLFIKKIKKSTVASEMTVPVVMVVALPQVL